MFLSAKRSGESGEEKITTRERTARDQTRRQKNHSFGGTEDSESPLRKVPGTDGVCINGEWV